MKKGIYDVMLNSTRMRVVQALASRESMTVNEIYEVINDVPRTTLYRHINILIEVNILTIVAERKIRGSLERTLALDINELSKIQYLENIPQQAFSFLMRIYSKFEKYFCRDTSVPSKNKIFFNNTVMMMNDDEFDKFLLELQGLFAKYHYEVAGGRKPRDLSIISAPPMEDNYE